MNTFILAINKNDFLKKDKWKERNLHLQDEVTCVRRWGYCHVSMEWGGKLDEEEKWKWSVCDDWCEYDGKSQELGLVGWKVKQNEKIEINPVCTVHCSARFLTGFDQTSSSNGNFRITRTGYLADSQFDRSNCPVRSESENIDLERIKQVEWPN